MRRRSTFVAASGAYRVREFADLAGVTVKALRHYDRLGLMRPARTAAGHRIYRTRDLERLRQVLALKQVGVPLTRMAGWLDAKPADLLTFLRARREELATQREQLSSADRALAVVEERLRRNGDDASLSRLADVIEARRQSAALNQYFSEEAWLLARDFYEGFPTAEWVDIYEDVVAAIPEGPGSRRAEELLQRWNALGRSRLTQLTSDPRLSRQLHEGFARSWRNRERWPQALQRRFADYRMNEIAAFLAKVSIAVLNRRGPSWFAPQDAPERREILWHQGISPNGAGAAAVGSTDDSSGRTARPLRRYRTY